MNNLPTTLGKDSMYTQVGPLVFLKTSMSTERSILKISVPGLQAQSVDFLAFVQFLQ